MMSGMFLYFSKATIEFNIRNTLKIYIYSTYVPTQVTSCCDKQLYLYLFVGDNERQSGNEGNY